MATDPTALTGQELRGAIIKPLYVERPMKVYAIYEAELTTLSMFSTAVTVCWSVASGAFTVLIDTAIDLSIAVPQDRPKHLVVGAISVAVILAAFVAGKWLSNKQSGQLEEILKTSKVLESPPM